MLRGYANPNEDVPSVATYRVHHYQHRLPHLATIAVVRFPVCKHCGDMVRFEKIEIATNDHPPLLRFDEDFEESCREIEVRNDKKKIKGSSCP